MKKLLSIVSALVVAVSLSLTANLLDTDNEYYDGVEKAPKIALYPQKAGDETNTVVIDQWQYYIEPGYLGYNRLTKTNITGAVKIEESDLNIEEPGTYYIRYVLSDNGQTTRVKRTVIVEGADKPANFVPVPQGELGNPGGVNLDKPTKPTEPGKEVEPEVIIKEVPVEKEVIKEVEKIVEVPAECDPVEPTTNWTVTIIAAIAGVAVGAGVVLLTKKH